MCIIFEIVDGTDVMEFLKEINCDGLITPEGIVALIRISPSSHDYYITTYPPNGGEGKISLFDSTRQDIEDILFHQKNVDKKQGNIINQDSMISEHKS